MESEQSSRLRTTSLTECDPSIRQRQVEYATERARLMFGCYRKGDANDPDTYVASIAAILADYELEVIRQVTDPRYGLPRRQQFMPTSKEVADECEIEQQRLDNIRLMAARKPMLRIAGPKQHRANVFVPATAPQYQAMVERAKKADKEEWRYEENRPGIWVCDTWMTGSMTKPPGFKRFTEAELMKLYPMTGAARQA